MVKDAESNADEDKKRRDAVDTRNQVPPNPPFSLILTLCGDWVGTLSSAVKIRAEAFTPLGAIPRAC